jgi:hypothetical protein
MGGGRGAGVVAVSALCTNAVASSVVSRVGRSVWRLTALRCTPGGADVGLFSPAGSGLSVGCTCASSVARICTAQA